MNFKEFRSKLNESKRWNDENVPAPMLVLRRRGMRIFPDGRHVALYTNDKYNLIFTIPYGGGNAPETDSPIVGQPGFGNHG